MTKHVVIIGAGIVGVSAAFQCLKSGLRVTLVDPGQPGEAHAASFGNAGWLSSHSILPPAYPGVWKQVPKWLLDPLGPLTVRWRYLPRALPWLKDYLASAWTYEQLKRTSIALRALLRDAAVLHREVATEIGMGDLIHVREVLHAYQSKSDYLADSRGWDLRREAGITWQTFDANDMRTLEPHLSSAYQWGVLVDGTGYCVDPSLYLKSLTAHCLDSGANLIRANASSFGIDAGVLRHVATDQGLIHCDAAVIAAGARGKELASQGGDDVPLATERGYHYVVRAESGGPNHPTMFMDKKVIVTPMTTGIRIAGQVEIAGLDDVPNWQRAEVLRKHLATLYPGLAAQISKDQISVWLGRRPSLPDGLPCIGRARNSKSIIHAYGHGHVGLAGSARTGRLVAQMLTSATPEIDISPYSAQRFRPTST